MTYQAIALNFTHHEIDDFIVDNPVLLLVNVVPIFHLLCYLFVHLSEIDDKVEKYRKVLVFKSIDSFSDAILICHEISFLEVYPFFYYGI